MRFPSITLAPPIPPQFMAPAELVFEGGFAAEILILQQDTGATEAVEAQGLPSISPPPYPEVLPSPLLSLYSSTAADAAALPALCSKNDSTENFSISPETVVLMRADNPPDAITPQTLMPDPRIEFELIAQFATLPSPFPAKALLAPDAPALGPFSRGLSPTPALGKMPDPATLLPAGLPRSVQSSMDRTGPSVLAGALLAAKAAPDTHILAKFAANQLAAHQLTGNQHAPVHPAPSLPLMVQAAPANAGPIILAPSTPAWPSTSTSAVAESHVPPPTQTPTITALDPVHPPHAPDPGLQRPITPMIAQEPTTPAPLFATKLDGLSVAPLSTPEPATAITDPQAKSDYPSHPMAEVFTADVSLPKNVSNIAQSVENFTNPLPMSSQDAMPQQSPAPAAAPRPDLLEVVLPSATPTPLRAALADQLILLVQSPPQGSVTLTLSPDDLGTLRFEVQHVADSISVHLTVERPETLDLLRRHADHLAEAFRQAGFSGASFTFGGGDGGQRDRPLTPSTPQWAETTSPTTERHVVGLLDMRL